MEPSEFFGTVFSYTFPWLPSIICGVLFVYSFIREPRQYRNALFFFGFLFWTVGMGLLWLGQESIVLILAAITFAVLPSLAVIALLLNTIVVVRHNGLSLSSLLPGALAAFIILMALAFFHYDGKDVPLWASFTMVLFLQEGLWFSFTYVSLFVYTNLYRLLPHKRVYDFIVVHGAGLMGEEPTPLLAGRVDKALELWEHQDRKGKIIVSGGQGADEVISEAEAMQRYLLKKGAPKEAIIKEDRSTTTMENLRFSKVIMDELSQGNPYRAAVVTSDYHVFRCAEYAHKLNIPCDGVGSHTRGWYWPAAFTREFVAITKAHWWPYAAIALCWLVICIIAMKGILY